MKVSEAKTGTLLRKGRPKTVVIRLKESILSELEAKRIDLSKRYKAEVSRDDLINSIIFNSRLEIKNLVKEESKVVKVKLMATMLEKLETLSQGSSVDEKKILMQMIEREMNRVY
jgi:hypothetical protein